jgi:hypothetical protein
MQAAFRHLYGMERSRRSGELRGQLVKFLSILGVLCFNTEFALF